MKKILVLVFIVLGAITQAQERVLVAIGKEGDKYYIYPSAIKNEGGGYLSVIEETIFTKPKYYTPSKYLSSHKMKSLIDCSNMKRVPISATAYSTNGAVIDNFSKSLSEVKTKIKMSSTAVPNTIGWDIIKEVCRRY